jgi:cytochrome d ubiquinol oxidase subunit I
MDALALSRIQFAVTAGFHFIFVPLTLGLSVIVAWMEARYVRTGDELYLRMARFWGKLFLINFALGVVTGITLEFQFGMNWAEYSKYVGDIFGAPLAIEATLAFFLESTFIGLWIFGWDKVSKKVHAAAIAIVAAASSLSALWILLANGWMQRPVGYVLRNGRAEMTDFFAVATNVYGWVKFTHTIFAGYVVAAFFVMGVAAYHIVKKQDLEFFKRSFRMAASFGVLTSLLVFLTGDFQASVVAKFQPSKLAAMESVWVTRSNAPYYLLSWPDPSHERNLFQALGIPNGLSLLSYQHAAAQVKGLLDYPQELRPPVIPTFVSFKLMAGLGAVFAALAVAAWVLARAERLERYPLFLWAMVLAIPLPYMASEFGWVVAELGRQPWIVYGLLKTSDAASKTVTAGQVARSLAGFTLLYGFLACVDFYLLFKNAKKGPAPRLQGA